MCATETGLVMWRRCAERWEQNQSYQALWQAVTCHDANIPAETATDYYKHVITIPLLDHVLMELNTRFTTHQVQATQGLVPTALHYTSNYNVYNLIFIQKETKFME